MKPLAVQLYSVRDAMAADPSRTLRRLAGMGYRAVEPTFGLLGGDPPGFRGLLDECGLAVCALHGPVLGAMRDEIADAAQAIGADTLIVPAIPASEFADAAGVTRCAQRLGEAARWAAGRGLRLGYHNHQWELAQHVGGYPALELLAALLPPEVIFELDLYWAAVGGADVPGLLGLLGDRVRLVHVKDGPATADDPMTAVGAGTLPMPAILAAIPAGAWRIVELDKCASDIFTALDESFGFLTGEGLMAGQAR